MNKPAHLEAPEYTRPEKFQALVDEFNEIDRLNDEVENIITELAELDLKTGGSDPETLNNKKLRLREKLSSAQKTKINYIRHNISYIGRLIDSVRLYNFGRISEPDQELFQDLKDKYLEYSANLNIEAAFKVAHDDDQRPIHIKDGQLKARDFHRKYQNGVITHEQALEEFKRAVLFVREQGLAMARQRGGEEDGWTAYDALLDKNAKGLNCEILDAYFDNLLESLVQMRNEIIGRQDQDTQNQEDIRRPGDEQTGLTKYELKQIIEAVAEGLGFDFTRGVILPTGHAAVEGGTYDRVRLLIQDLPDNPSLREFMTLIVSVTHEVGHALDFQCRKELKDQKSPFHTFDMIKHEAIALLTDRVIGRSHEYHKYLERLVRDMTGCINITAEKMQQLTRTVAKEQLTSRGSDQISYHILIAMRYRLEKLCINEKIDDNDLEFLRKILGEEDDLVKEYELRREFDIDKDLGAVLKAMYSKYLGVEVAEEKDAIDYFLNPVHPFVGKFGYLPCYSLAHGVAIKLDEDMQISFCEDNPSGFLDEAKKWLVENVFNKPRVNTEGMAFIKKQFGHNNPSAMISLANEITKHLRERMVETAPENRFSRPVHDFVP